MEDLISRQAAIDASCKDWCGCTYANCPNQFDLESERFCDGCDTVVILKRLPSAQPEEDCNTCKHGYFGDFQCDNCGVRYPSHYEREEEHHGSD